MVEKQDEKHEGTEKHEEKLEFKLSVAVTALINAVEDVSKQRLNLGVIHVEKGKAVVADGYALVQVEDEEILTESEPTRVVNIPFAVIRPHCGKDVTVAVSGNGKRAVSVAHEIRAPVSVIHKTETALPVTVYPNFTKIVADALSNTYSACIALDTSKLKRLLKLFYALQKEEEVRFYIPTNPTQPVLLTMNGGDIKALLMPMFVDWEKDGIKKEQAKTIKYEEEKP